MPDISMCNNDKCPSASTCYRHEAKPDSLWQAWSIFVVREGLDKCESYLPLPHVKLRVADVPSVK